MLDAAVSRGAAMEQILTNPDQLADYTNRFFTEVYPVDADVSEQQSYQPRYDQLPAVPASAMAGAPAANSDTQWNGFTDTMNRNPDQAWRYLSQMSPDAFRSKLLFMDAS